MTNDFVWIVDDDKSIRWIIHKALDQQGIKCKEFNSANEAINEFNRSKPSLIISDINMPGESGIEFLKKVKDKFPLIPILIMTAYSDLESTLDSYKFGAYEYLTKPFDINILLDLIKKIINENLYPTSNKPDNKFNNNTLLGESLAMQEVYKSIGKLSRSDASILITGESGTGKELVAKLIHNNSVRSEKPFIVVNSAAIPSELLESELFGYEKGAFTGASNNKAGFFDAASGGTLFLDEIGDMPINLQAKILRVLNDGYFQKVGSNKTIKADVRILTATHQDLKNKILNNEFREDLYHRLNVINIDLPALRDRSGDIPLLADFFLKSSSHELNIAPKYLNEETEKFFQRLNWKGNVRQLRNICHWLSVMVSGNEIGISDLPTELINENINRPISQDWFESIEYSIIDDVRSGTSNLYEKYVNKLEEVLFKTVLNESNNKKIKAAKILGIGRNTFTRKYNHDDG
jgi:two-component system nitrogen regulation response regulator GlnG